MIPYSLSLLRPPIVCLLQHNALYDLPRAALTTDDALLLVELRVGANFVMQQRKIVSSPTGINIDSLDQMGTLMTVQFDRDSCDDSLGFSVRGGSEHGLGVFVSEIEQGTMAGESNASPSD